MTTFDAATFARLRSLFEQLCDQSPEQQQAWLDAHVDDPELQAHLRAMLQADAAVGPLDQTLLPRVEQLLGNAAGAATIEGYRIIRPLGRGGMGEVYLAERHDASFEQTVALKLSLRSQDASARQRFIDEQRILARLEHPCIARLIDGGIDSDGRAWLALEYVDGCSLIEHCQAQALDLRARLRLFQQICGAVAYAHRNLIVHRDLKPGNILISREGLPKLLDFGIAKMLSADEVEHTATAAGLMTPAYAAPEQLLGRAITTSTDVYALGLLLFELICGQRAQPVEGRTLAEIERLVCVETAPRPSRLAAQGEPHRHWAKVSAGDLDIIVAKALAKEPERRYPSAQALSDDIDNWLHGLPIAARPHDWRYRSARFIARHRWPVAGAGLVVLLLAVTATVATIASIRVNHALALSQLEARKAEQIARFLSEAFAAVDPEQNAGQELSIRQVLDRSAARIDQELDADPLLQGNLHAEIGGIYFNQGAHQPALDHLQRAVALLRSAPGAELDLADALRRQALAADGLGEGAAAVAAAREALTLRQARLAAEDPAVAESLSVLGSVLAGQGDLDEARSLLEDAQARLVGSVGEADGRTLDALHNLAWVQSHQGDHVGAERTYRRVLAASADRADPDHPDHLTTLENLGLALRQQGRLTEAEPIYRDVLERRRRRLGDDSHTVGVSSYNLAGLLYAMGDYAAAEPLFQAALQNWSQSLGEDHRNVALALSALGRLQAKTGNATMAIQTLQTAVQRLHAHRPALDARYADAALVLGRLQCPIDGAAATALLQEVLQLRQEDRNGSALAIGEAQLELGDCLQRSGKNATSDALIRSGADAIRAAEGASAELLARVDAVAGSR